MNDKPCFGCGMMYADCDHLGRPITYEYCHFVGPEEWAPCYTEEPDEPEDYPEFENSYETEEYWNWLLSSDYDYIGDINGTSCTSLDR